MNAENESGVDPGEDTRVPNASPELQDAIRSIDAIGESAWGKDDDQDALRGDTRLSETDANEPDGNRPPV
jgi:hypothetical protein